MSDSQPSTDIREWNAPSYHKVALPHVDWGSALLAALPLRGNETVADLGCGSGRLTALLLERLPEGIVIAVDQSANMLAEAEAHLRPRFGGRVRFRQADIQDLTLDPPVDAIFSTATFHWLPDHAALFRHLHDSLEPGGLLLAQCGGAGNIARLLARLDPLMHSEPYAAHFGDWPGPWNFATEEETQKRLTDAGFMDIETSRFPAPVTFADPARYREFLTTVVLGSHLRRLPTRELRDAFVATVTELARDDDPPWTLDYWRLNLQGRRPE